jgi:hypothetical protein
MKKDVFKEHVQVMRTRLKRKKKEEKNQNKFFSKMTTQEGNSWEEKTKTPPMQILFEIIKNLQKQCKEWSQSHNDSVDMKSSKEKCIYRRKPLL